MYRILRCTILIIGLSIVTITKAQDELSDSGVPEDRNATGAWFASGLYSLNIANNGMTYSRIGGIGGYLNNWGGYAKIDFPINGSHTPNFSGGMTKRLATFRNRNLSNPSTLHLYVGIGYGTILHGVDWPEHDHIYHPDGTVECLPDTERTTRYWDESGGILIEAGLIYRYRHINFILGTGITPDLGGAIFGSGISPNIPLQLGVGYTF